MLLIYLQVLVVGLIILVLFALRRRFGLMLLFIFVGSNQWVQSWLATTVYAEAFGRFPVSPGSAVLFSSSLAVLLLVYIEEDIPTTRRLIYGIVLANVGVIAVAQVTKWGLAQGYLFGDPSTTTWLENYDMPAFALGTFILMLDSVMLLVLFQGLTAKLPRTPLWCRVVLSLWVTLILDSFVFVGVALRSSPMMQEVLVGNLLGKSIGAWGFGLLISAYVSWRRPQNEALETDIYDLFSIFTYRERFQLLQEEKVEAEREARRESERADLAAQASGLGLWDWHLDTGRVYVDERWTSQIGYAHEEFEGTWEAWRNMIHPEDLARVRDTQSASYDSDSTLSVEYRIREAGGEWRWMLCLGRVQERGEDGRPLRVTGTHLDVTEQKETEAHLRQSERQMRRLAARLEAIREEERKAISQEIHDELGQTLTGLKMDLSWIDSKLEDRGLVGDRVRSMIDQVDSTVDAVRDLSSRLRPAALDDLGLCEAVEWQVEDFGRRSGLAHELDIVVDEPDIKPESAIAVFRILQESLTNVARHAGASKVAVELKRESGGLVLRVSDDGGGIEDPDYSGEGRLGLLGMKERALGLGGSLEIGRSAHGGAAITVRVPL